MFTPYNQILFFEEQLCMTDMDYTDQAQIKSDYMISLAMSNTSCSCKLFTIAPFSVTIIAVHLENFLFVYYCSEHVKQFLKKHITRSESAVIVIRDRAELCATVPSGTF
jgi:hypothetical protein